MKKIADAGLLIAALDKGDEHHAWARNVLQNESPPWLVCEAVLTEAAASIGAAEPVLEMLQVGDLELAFDLSKNKSEVLSLLRKYRDQSMDMGDACVVRMSELYGDSIVYTVDKTDFRVYRRYSRQTVPCVFPD